MQNTLVLDFQAWPKGVARAALADTIPEAYAKDYREACTVLGDSARAAAAIARYCLQRLLRDQAQVKPGDLVQEINAAVAAGKFPPYVNESFGHAIRHYGNFSVHPIPDQQTGAIIEVEPGEAEWCLDILETLFDFYFVQPAKAKAKLDALNTKLDKAGKPPVKS